MASVKFVKLRFRDAKLLEKRIEEYFAAVRDADPIEVAVGKNLVSRKVPPTPAGLAHHLGITTQTLGRYMRGEVKFDGISESEGDEIIRVLTKARMKIESELVGRGLVGDLDNSTVRQALIALGYNKCIDDEEADANATLRIVVEGATQGEVKSWSK